MSEDAYKIYPHHLENRPDLSWVDEMKDRVRCKVRFYNSCGIIKKLVFALIHGRNFVPTNNEKHLAYLYGLRMSEVQKR